MKKSVKLLLMLLLGIAGIGFAIAAIHGALYREPSVIPGKYWWQACISSGMLSVWCFIGVKKVFNSWYE